jgi:AcrR family transcriptional regulator
MVTRTVNESRADTLLPRIAELGAEPARREAVALGLVDALLDCDAETLDAVLPALRDARARTDGNQELSGWLDAAIAFVGWGLERVPTPAAVAEGTQAHEFLRALDGSPSLGSAQLQQCLEVDETQVSRSGRRLLESGLVTRSKVGRQVFWQLTPRGRRALEDTPARRRSTGTDFWREALRRGFEAARGDEPGAPREVDPTRERIVKSTLELHTSQGVQATTTPQIAELAGLPVETIEALFPTQDDLVRGCGQHIMESLQVPPVELAPRVFTGAASEHERIHRMVETVFGAYERGAGAIAAGRREREVALVDESMQELDNSFDALVLEALRPNRPGASSVAALRALTDLEVWRALRDQGATPDAAVDQASTTVERWLEAQPA